MYHKMKTIRSEAHDIGSYEINTISLSAYDDKRYILKDGVNSYAYSFCFQKLAHLPDGFGQIMNSKSGHIMFNFFSKKKIYHN